MTARWEAIWASSDNWVHVALVALIIAAVAQSMFVAVYGTRQWFRVRPGRALWFKSLAFAVILDLSVVNDLWDYRWQEQISAIAVLFVAVTVVYQLYALLLSPRHPEA